MNGQFTVSLAVPPRSKPGPGEDAPLEKSQPRAPRLWHGGGGLSTSKAVTPCRNNYTGGKTFNFLKQQLANSVGSKNNKKVSVISTG